MVRIAVIGCGLLGVKIVGEFAYHGHRVKCYDNNVSLLNSVYSRYQNDKSQLYSEQLIESSNFIGQVLCLSRLEETVNDAQIVIECVSEDFDAKSALFEKISNLCPLDCIIVTNTLRLDISKLASFIKNKERFTGLRFLYPVYYISEVEITTHKETANWVTEKLRNILSLMGKTLFFRSGLEPLILTEEKREIRKQQRIDELRYSNGLPPLRQNNNVPDLGRYNNNNNNNTQNDILKIFNLDKKNKLQNNNNKKNIIFNNKNNNKNIINDLNDSNSNSYLQSDNDCAICMDISRNSVLRPCNHMITCYDCSILLLNRQDNCPVCREKIEDVIKIFMS